MDDIVFSDVSEFYTPDSDQREDSIRIQRTGGTLYFDFYFNGKMFTVYPTADEIAALKGAL